jgi:trimeric autotransporter adhesin
VEFFSASLIAARAPAALIRVLRAHPRNLDLLQHASGALCSLARVSSGERSSVGGGSGARAIAAPEASAAEAEAETVAALIAALADALASAAEGWADAPRAIMTLGTALLILTRRRADVFIACGGVAGAVALLRELAATSECAAYGAVLLTHAMRGGGAGVVMGGICARAASDSPRELAALRADALSALLALLECDGVAVVTRTLAAQTGRDLEATRAAAQLLDAITAAALAPLSAMDEAVDEAADAEAEAEAAAAAGGAAAAEAAGGAGGEGSGSGSAGVRAAGGGDAARRGADERRAERHRRREGASAALVAALAAARPAPASTLVAALRA